MDPHHFHGKDIPHIKLDPKMNIEDLVEVFASSGFNGRQLGEAAKLMTLMNLFTEDEEYEKCAIIKARMDEVNRILKKKK